MSRRVRVGKLAVILWGSITAVNMTLVWYFPRRVTSDELPVAYDVHAALSTGHVPGQYINGGLYQSGVTVLLRLTGLEYGALEVVSPLFGTVAFGLFIWVGTRLFTTFSGEAGPWWAAGAFLPAFLAFPGFLLRIRESSHKAYTFVFLFAALYLAVTLLTGRRDGRLAAVLTLLASTIVLANWIWGAVFGAYVGGLLLLTGSVLYVASFGVALAMVTLVGVLNPLTSVDVEFFVDLMTNLSGQGEPASGPTTDASEREEYRGGTISQASANVRRWPSVELFGRRFTSWYVYISSVLVAGLWTAGGMVAALWYAVRSQSVRPVRLGTVRERLRLVPLLTSGYFGVLFVVLAVAGSVATAKRVVVLPGIVGVCYWVSVLARRTERSPGNDTARALLVLTAITLLLTASVGVPRLALDGEMAPYDTYASGHEIAETEWIAEFDRGCLYTDTEKDSILAAKITGELREPRPVGPTDSVVYHSGRDGRVACHTGVVNEGT